MEMGRLTLIGRRTFEIGEKDVVLFNGACWQLITQTIFKGRHNTYPRMAKSLCQKLLKKNVLILVKKEKEYMTSDGEQMGLYYYKFDIDKLAEFLEQEEKV